MAVPKQVTFIFSKMQKDEKFNSLGHLRRDNTTLHHYIKKVTPPSQGKTGFWKFTKDCCQWRAVRGTQ
jgi:hypothetical protein